MGLSKFNKGTNKIEWGINTEGWKFYSAVKELKDGEKYPFLGCFITKDNGYGEGGVIITDGKLINTPAAFVDTIKEIIADPESVEVIKQGNETFSVRHFTSEKFKKESVDIILN